MRIIFPLFLYLLFSASPVFAGDCVRLNGQNGAVFAGDFLEYAEIGGEFNRADIVGTTDNKFRPVPDPFASFGYTEKNYLLRFKLCPSTGQRKIFVQIKGLYPEARAWFVAGSCITRSASCKPIFAERTDLYRDALFAFETLPPETGTVYLAVFPPGSRRYPVHVLDADGLIKAEQRFFWLTGLFFGALAAILLYNAALFLAIRERINLYYSLYLSLLLLLFLTLERIPEDTFGHSANPAYLIFRSAIFPLMLIPFALFTRAFLQTAIGAWQSPVWRVMIFADIALILLNFFIAYRSMMPLNLWAVVLHCLMALICTIQAAWTGFKPARILFFGWLLFLVSAILSSLHLMGRFSVGFNDYFPHLIKFGSIAENLLFTAALGLRVRFLKHQAEQFAAKLTAERENLAGDLHDVLGSEFGEMQMKLHQAGVSAEIRLWFSAKARSMGDRIRDMVFLLRSDLSSRTIAEEMSATILMLSSLESLRFDAAVEKDLTQTDPFLLLDALRILQEWSGNCMKYGHPTEMHLRVEKRGKSLRLGIVSDGRLFSWNGRQNYDGAGLAGIKIRTARRHGHARCICTQSRKNVFVATLVGS